MKQKINDNAVLFLLFMPAFSALIKLFVSFSELDLIYLIIVAILFIKCKLTTRKQ